MQTTLPLEEAEGTFAERRNLLGLAMLRVGADLHLRELIIRVFNVTKGGIAGDFKATVAEIASTPWGLCCSAATARRTIRLALSYRWLIESPTVRADKGDGPNAYRINWKAIKESIDLRRRPTSELVAQRTAGGGCQVDRPHYQNDMPPYQSDSAFKEHSFLSSFSSSTSTPTDDDAGTWQTVVVELKALKVRAVDATIAAARARGATSLEALHMIGLFRSNRSMFKPDEKGEIVGALCWALKTGEWPDGIRPVDPATAAANAAAVKASEAQRKAEDDARRQAEAEADAANEVAYGARLDLMDDEEVKGLDKFVGPYAVRSGSFRTTGDPTRLVLLRILAKGEHVTRS